MLRRMRKRLLALPLLVALGCAGLLPTTTPYQGDASLELVLEGSGSTATIDGPRILARFAEVGVDASVTATSEQSLAVTLSGVSESVDLRPMFAPQVTTLELAGTSMLTPEHYADAQLDEDPFGLPVVVLTLTENGTRVFCEGSEAAIGQPLAIMSDGVELSAPIVQEAICGGVVHISGVQDGAQALALAAALRGKPLESGWTVVEQR